jgi:hypothetical protein
LDHPELESPGSCRTILQRNTPWRASFKYSERSNNLTNFVFGISSAGASHCRPLEWRSGSCCEATLDTFAVALDRELLPRWALLTAQPCKL